MHNLKLDFPFFRAHPEVVYLDNAATTHKPDMVIERMQEFYAHEYASVYRGMYKTADVAAERYEAVRTAVAQWIGASASHDIVFTRGATESIHLVAAGWAAQRLQAGDEIVLSELEHHANILPWQRLAQERGVVLTWIRLSEEGVPLYDPALITLRTKLVCITAASNVLGDLEVLAPGVLSAIIVRAHEVGARVLVDAAQCVPHRRINVQNLGADFLVFSAHKMLGPQGVGVLYVAPEAQTELQPVVLGGGAVSKVSHEAYSMRPFPHAFEAGTLPVAGVLGFGAALEYLLERVDFDALAAYESYLVSVACEELCAVPGVRILGPEVVRHTGSLISFVLEGVHAHDVAAYLAAQDIAVRAGNQCASLVHKALGVMGSVRASMYVYTMPEDVAMLSRALKQLPRAALTRR